MKIDRDEQLIRSAFSQIEVNTENIERKVKENMNNRIIKPIQRKRISVFAAVVAIMLLTGSIAAAATLGVFDRFITERDPVFGSVVTPIEKYVVDQGIRVDIIAAQSFGNSAIIYMSVQDVSGQNRVTENVQILPHLMVDRDDTRFGWSSLMGGMEVMYFDKSTDTAYFQIKIQDFALIPNVMELVINEITFENRSKEIDFPIALSDMTAASMIPNPNHVEDLQFPTWCAEYILTPSNGGNFPAIPGDSWISNVAIMNGQLHVQITSPRRMERVHGENLVTMGGAMLTNESGDWVAPVNQTWLEVDENFQTLSNEQQQNMTQDELIEWFENSLRYSIHEVIFPIDVTALDSYSLTLSGGVHSSTAGNWSMTIYTGDSSDNIRVMAETGTVRIGDAMIESVTVSPLGVSFKGSVEGGINEGVASLNGRSVWLETNAGNILVQENPGVGFSTEFDENGIPANATVDGFARSDSPIDVSAVTAVIIGDVHIVVE